MTWLIKSIFRIGATLGSLAFWGARAAATNGFRDTRSENELCEFFRHPMNYANRSIKDIEVAFGIWNDFVDWDRGRVNYEWVGGNLRVRVCTESQHIVAVDFYYSRGGKKRTGKPDQEVWTASHTQ